jgi:hypothetical protein
MQDTFYTRSGSSPTKPEWTGRCDRCGSWLRYAIPHTCRPGAERYWRALQAAWALITPLNDWRTYPTSRPIDGLPAPAPRLVIDLVSAPRSLRSESVSVESSAVTLLPLIQATSAQRAGEPMTLKPRSYPPNLSISALRRKYRCGVGLCTPAALSTQFHNLPWSYSVALEAPSTQEFWFRLLYFEKTALMALDTLSTGLLTDPFYILSIISHNPVNRSSTRIYSQRIRRTGYHAHLLVGNLDWSELQSLLKSWDGFVAPNSIRRVDRLPSTPWKALHYCLSNDPWTGVAEIDSLPNLRHLPLRHMVDMGRGDGHCDGSPIFSPTLDAVLARWKSLRASGLSPSRSGAARRRQPSRSRQARRLERQRSQQKGATS